MKETTCKGCGAPIVYVRTVSGQKMPIDAEPVWVRLSTGGHTFIRPDGSFVFGTRAGDADDDPDANFIEAHENHKVTCPVGGKSRKARKPRERKNRSPFF